MFKPNTLDVSAARADRVGTIAGSILVIALLVFVIGILANGLMLFGIATGLGGLQAIGQQVGLAALGTSIVALALSVLVWFVGTVAWVR